MARGRTFRWESPDGISIELQDWANGYRVLEGVTGLGKPQYNHDNEANALVDGLVHRGTRAVAREVFLPMEIIGSSRTDFLGKASHLSNATNPKKGAGYLYITDGGETWRLSCMYKNGMEGVETAALSGQDGEEHWQVTGPVFECLDPFFNSTLNNVREWGFGAPVGFFPLLPIKLNSNQVMSDVSQPSRFNRLRNPSGETVLSFWDAEWFAGSPDTSYVRSVDVGAAPGGGSWAIKATNQNNAANHGASQLSDASLTIGQQYTLHGWMYVPSTNTADQNPRLQIPFVAEADSVTERDQWVWRSVVFTATATSHRAAALFLGSVDASNFVQYVDKWAITEGVVESPDEYIDGDQLYSHWSGTEHASTSFQDALFEPATINYAGTVETFPTIKLIGPGTDLTLENTTTNRRLTANLGTALAAGVVATLDMTQKTFAREDGVSLYQYLVQDDFWSLVPGINTLRLSMAGSAVGSKIVLTWNDRKEALVL